MDSFDERIFAAARLLKANQFDDVIPVLMRGQARYKAANKTKRKRGVKVKLFGKYPANISADIIEQNRFAKDKRDDWELAVYIGHKRIHDWGDSRTA